jgi:hypothetical protein
VIPVLEENKLLKEAEGLKGSDEAPAIIAAEATNDGLSDDDVRLIVKSVMERLAKTESGNVGHAFGKAHDPKDEHAAIKTGVQDMLT